MTDADHSQISLAFAEITMVLEEAGSLASLGQDPNLPEQCYAELSCDLQTLVRKAEGQINALLITVPCAKRS